MLTNRRSAFVDACLGFWLHERRYHRPSSLKLERSVSYIDMIGYVCILLIVKLSLDATRKINVVDSNCFEA